MLYEKKRRLSLTLVLFAILSVLAHSLTGCEKITSPAVSDYRNHNARFTLEFPSRTESVICSAEKLGEDITITVVSPERSAGLTVSVSGENCILLPRGSDNGITLSYDASSGLTDVLSLMFAPSDGASVTRSADGESTIITHERGAVTLDCALTPISVEIYEGDRTRTVKVRDYEIAGAAAPDKDNPN